MVRLRSLDHDVAGGIRYTASKNPSLNRLSRTRMSKKSASRCRRKNASSKTPANFWTTSDIFNAANKSDSTLSSAATRSRRRTVLSSFTLLVGLVTEADHRFDCCGTSGNSERTDQLSFDWRQWQKLYGFPSAPQPTHECFLPQTEASMHIPF